MKKYLEKGNKQIVQPDYIWPISRSATPDEINTSFGPRINNNEWYFPKWQFHRGIDEPAPEDDKNAPVYAMHSGSIHLAGDGDTGTFESRHVVIKVGPNTKNSRALFLIYLHLSKRNKNLKKGVEVEKGDYIGNVGKHKATYHHLHIEFREATKPGSKGKLHNMRHKHPLNYLPYPDTANFNGKLITKYQKSGPTNIKARLSFRGIDKNEGDLLGVEVSLFKNGSIINQPKIVDFENAQTIDKSGRDDDRLIFKKGIGVEGYQKSDMASQGYHDLHYGILIQNIPDDCNKLSARVFDIGGNVTVYSDIAISQPSSFEQSLNFEDGFMPPVGWKIVRSIVPTNNNDQSKSAHVYNEAISAYSGKRGMLCRLGKFSGSGSHAAIEYKLPYNEYFEFFVKAMINPYELQLSHGNSIYPLYFLNNKNSLSVAAGIYKSTNNILQTRLIAKNPDGTIKHSGSDRNNNRVRIQEWRKWRLELRRIDTRETTVTLSLGYENNSASVEVAHISYDSRDDNQPRKLRIGIGFCSSNASGTIFTDNIQLSSNK